jgi:two-component system response regulator (stage 0 sporulation protein F)
LSVVDDEPDIMSLFKEALSHIGDTDVFGFIDSTLALEHFKLHQLDYCLILSDYRMPTIDGMELLKKVKAINPSVKTILISAFEVNDEVFEQCDYVDVFLQKPISIPDLIDAVETQIASGK